MRDVAGSSIATGLILAGSVGAALSAFLVPVARRWYQRRGWVDAPGGRRIHEHATPLAGGIAVLVGVLAGLVASWMAAPAWPAWAGSDRVLTTNALTGPNSLMMMGIAGLLLFLLGSWDDVAELRPRIKLVGQTMVAILAVGGGARLPLFQAWPAGQLLVSVLFFVAVVNAVNFLDNMNGLCAGLGCIAAVQLALIGVRLGEPTLTVASGALAGACAGLLPFNYPKASVFLGDAGSHVVGGLIALLAMQACGTLGAGTGAGVGDSTPLSPLWVLAVPGYDLVQVVVGRIRRGQPVHVGDTHHVSHQLTRLGFSRASAVLVLWMIAVVAGMFGVLSSYR